MTDVGQVPEDDPIRERAVRGVMAFGIRGLAIRAVGLVGSALLARLLVPDEFGLVALGGVVISFSATFASGGLGAFLIQQSQAPTRRELQIVFGFQLLLVVPIVAAFVAAAILWGGNAVFLAIMALALPIAVVRVPPAIVCERDLNFGPVVRSEIYETIVYNVAAVGLVWAGMGVTGVAVATVARSIVGSAVLVVLSPLRVLIPAFRLREARPMLRFGVTFQGIALLELAREVGANLVLAVVAGLSVVGYWSIAFRLLQPVLLLVEPLERVMFPSMARLTEQGSDTAAPLERAVSRTAVLMGFFAVALAGSAPALVPVVFGPGWSQAVPTLSVAAIGLLVYGPMNFCGTGYLLGIGKAGIVLRTTALYTVVWLAGTVVLVPPMGTVGVSVAMVAAGIATSLYIHTALRQAGANTLRAASGPVLFTLIAAAPGLLAAHALDSAKWVALPVSLAVSEGLYLLLILVLSRRVLLDLVGLLREGLRRSSQTQGATPSGDGEQLGEAT